MIVLCVCCIGCAADDKEMDLATIVEKHTDARGGATKIEAVQSVALDIRITEPTFSVTGKYAATRAGFVRVDIFSGETRVFTEAIGPTGGWQMDADENVSCLSQDGFSALDKGRIGNLMGLHERSQLGYSLQLETSSQTDKSHSYYVVETSPNGFIRKYEISPDTFLIESVIETSALHPDIDAQTTPQNTKFLARASVSGVLFHTTSEKRNLTDGTLMQRAEVLNRVVNSPFVRGYFSPPKMQGISSINACGH